MKRTLLRQHQVGNVIVVVRRHATTKSLKLKIDPIRKIPIVTVPTTCPTQTIKSFLSKQEAWLAQQMVHVQPQSITEDILFKGDSYKIEVLSKGAFQSDYHVNHEDKLIFFLEGKQSIARKLKHFMVREALNYGQNRSQFFASQLNVSFNQIVIKDYRSRWGSCSSRGNLTFSWRLIQAPPEVYDYVCAHEVAHLIHMNHSHAFWEVVASICPHHQKSRQWLKINGAKLFQYL